MDNEKNLNEASDDYQFKIIDNRFVVEDETGMIQGIWDCFDDFVEDAINHNS